VVGSLASAPVDTAGHIEVVVDREAAHRAHWAAEHTVVVHTLLGMAVVGDIVRVVACSQSVLAQMEH
jgi:hypothetical protein